MRARVLFVVASVAAIAMACSGGHAKPAARSGNLAGKDAVRQSEVCAPASDPLALVLPSLVRIETAPDAKGAYSAGTGIIIDQGWLLTNQHVVDSVGSGLVRTFYGDGHTAPGRVVASDPDLDLALVQTDTGDLQSVTWGDEGQISAGTILLAVGFARGAPRPSYSQGRYVQTIVDRSTGQAFIESDVPLEHGDSGGPLLNRCGQVIGINTARINGTSAGGQYAGLSIPGYGARRWAIRNRPQ